VTLKKPDGFVASSHYWEISRRNPERFPLREARYFIYKLEEKAYFCDAIRKFNEKTRTNWLEESNLAILGGYLCSFWYALKPALTVVMKGSDEYLRPKIAKRRRRRTD
jgi:hypothetical protein